VRVCLIIITRYYYYII